KLDTRAAIFKDDKILLVKENNGTWSMPGGWVDVLESIESNTIKEVQEEAGILVKAERIIAIQDRNKHNKPIYAYGVCKVFVQCRKINGEFKKNIETVESEYFSLESLPKKLANEKNTKKQIEMCFEANNSKSWETLFD
ncbi:MAG: NUDIX domain-containing protein, partial [Clostridium sp.]|uniref:NUDIX domain-containing protein n=1 Tax=Clostridium sp. TaxID=1506 RepID=UPI003EE6604C